MKTDYRISERTSLINFFWYFIFLGFFLLPVLPSISTPIFIGAIILSVIWILKYKKWDFITVKKFWILLSFPFLIILLLLSLIYTVNIDYGIEVIGRSIPLLFFPILLIFIPINEESIKRLMLSLTLGVLLTFFYNLFIAIYNSVEISGGSFHYDPSIAGGYSFFESFKHGGSHFIGNEFSKQVHPSYMSIYALFCVVYLVKRIAENRIYKFIVVLFILYIFLLASRASILILLILVLLKLYDMRPKKMWIFSTSLILTLLAVVLFNPRVHTLYYGLKSFNDKENYNYTTSEQSRILTYKSSLKLIFDSPFFGYGVGDANDSLLQEYIINDYKYNAKYKYNAHNQFFQTYLQAGFLGFVFLSLPFLYLICRRKSDIYTMGYLIILIISLCFESMLVRYNGIIFYSIMVPIFLKVSINICKE